MENPRLTAAHMLGAHCNARDRADTDSIHPNRNENTLSYEDAESWLESMGLLHTLATDQCGIMIKDHAIATVLAIYEVYEDEGFESLAFAVHSDLELVPTRTANAVVTFCKTVYAATLPAACMYTEAECAAAHLRQHFEHACDWCNAKHNVNAFSGGMHPWDHWAIKRSNGLPKKRANTV